MNKLVTGRAVAWEVGNNKRYALWPVSFIVTEVHISAIPSNTGSIYIGDLQVNAISGTEQGQRLIVDSTTDREDIQTLHNVDLNDIYFSATVANEGITWLALYEVEDA